MKSLQFNEKVLILPERPIQGKDTSNQKSETFKHTKTREMQSLPNSIINVGIRLLLTLLTSRELHCREIYILNLHFTLSIYEQILRPSSDERC
jgi:hypothetical protein